MSIVLLTLLKINLTQKLSALGSTMDLNFS